MTLGGRAARAVQRRPRDGQARRAVLLGELIDLRAGYAFGSLNMDVNVDGIDYETERNWTPDRDFQSTVALGGALAATSATGATSPSRVRASRAGWGCSTSSPGASGSISR